MPGTCIIGLQWGDEAKGKLCDILCREHDIVVRFLGGANAGHTVVAGDRTYKLHHIPSGVLSPGIMNVVTAGVVINPPVLLKEIEGLTAQGVEIGQHNLMLSDRAHIVLPWHVAEDRVLNSSTADGESIGTTLRGIGPCYRDKVGRSHAVRLGDMFRDTFRQTIDRVVAAKTRVLSALDSDVRLDPAQIFDEYSGYAARLQSLVGDSTDYLLNAVDAKQRLLFEGAQGSLLDVDHGTYPFVTSSNSSGVGVSAGSGVPARFITKTIGVVKAYSTRVGGGPFPTELLNATGERIRERGREYGTTTGRPRRCGWFDAVAVRYTARLSGVDILSLMMLDVLSGMPEIQVCTAYDLDGERINSFPSHVDDLRRVQPVYETLPGWPQEITTAKKLTDLPPNARAYLDRISELVNTPIGVVSIGPDRAQTIFV